MTSATTCGSRGRRRRRRGHHRLRVEHRPARPDLPGVQGGRDRLTGLREPDLGDARVLAPVREGRCHRPRQRRLDARDRRPARDGARDGTETRRLGRRQPRLGAWVPDDQAGDDLRAERRGCRRRRPPRLAARRRSRRRPQDAGVRRCRPRGLEPPRPGGDLHPDLRAAGGSCSRPACRRRSSATSIARSCGGSPRGASAPSPTRRASARATRKDLLDSLDAEAIRERHFRIVVDYGYSAASFVLPLVVGPVGVEAISAHGFFAEELGERESPPPRRSGTRNGS